MKIENAKLISFDIMIMQLRVNVFYSIYEKEDDKLRNNVYKLTVGNLKRIEYSSNDINFNESRKMDIDYNEEEGLLLLKLEEDTIKIYSKNIEIEKIDYLKIE